MAHLASSKVGEIFQGKMRLPNLGSILTDTGDKRAYFCSFLLLGAVLGLARLVGTPSFVSNKHVAKASKSLLAMAVGIKQKTAVDQIVEKFFSSNFTIMLFHYDDVVDEWRDLQWSGSALHVSAINQTKWWFAKLFLYPDVVAEYNYIFLWDEDLGVEHFHPGCYISMIEREGLEISPPVSDVAKLEVHHQITACGRQEDVQRQSQLIGVDGVCYYVLLVFSSFICCLTGFKLDRGRSFSASGSKISFSSF
uniref:Uncharacterized protein LOC105035549 isoform X3 n=1 Tax=Elaeis guineensis var. tenera TaxID=51953 RepID=A0A6I9QJL0_ELAGV|nr:uncharacterized protein LOC105035549 isoform X3 [Elaeis guineensis]